VNDYVVTISCLYRLSQQNIEKRDLRETSPLLDVLQPIRQPLQKASASIVLMIRIISSESWNGN
jgi:hypothetical protein